MKKSIAENVMEPIQKALKKKLILAVILTLCMPLGGALLGVGLGIGQPAVWAIGIALLAIGFYGAPVGWAASYSPTRSLARIVSAIMVENLHTVQEIAQQLSLSEKEVRSRLDICFQKQYLPGIKRDGDTLILNENEALGKKEEYAECPACGARFLYTKDNKFCPYCGTPVRK